MTPAPYPANTLAKGWRFELDIEKLKQSDTWRLATTGTAKGALLLLWVEAWQQAPCGTLPDDDELIGLMCGLPAPAYLKHRKLLRRGWTRADDGRLYHETITGRVLSMLVKRAKDAKRTAERRGRNAEPPPSPPEVPDVSRVTSPGVLPEFDTKHQAPEPEETEKDPPASDLVDRAALDPPAAERKTRKSPGYTVPDCPYDALLALYHEALPSLPRVEVFSPARRATMRSRWVEVCAADKCDQGQGVEFFRQFFVGASKSKFLTGRSSSNGKHEGWRADLDFLLTPAKFAKVLEGRYHGEHA